MNKRKTVYCYTDEYVNLQNDDQNLLQNKYILLGSGTDVKQFFDYDPNSIDYLIVFAPKNKMAKLDKCLLMFLKHVFNNIVVVADTKVNILQDYYFVQSSLVGKDISKILKVVEKNKLHNINYSYKNYCKVCGEILLKIGVQQKHNGYAYLIDCSYIVASIEPKCKLYSYLYNSVATKFNVSVESVERCIRTAINAARESKVTSKGYKRIRKKLETLSNKKFIKELNLYVMQKIM